MSAPKPVPCLLLTRRLRLQPLVQGDLPDLHEHWSEPEVGRWLFDGEAPSIDKVDEELGQSSRLFAELGVGIWGVYVPSTPRLIGTCGFLRVDEIDEIEILFSLAPERWRQGFAREASEAVLERAFGAARLERIVGRCDVPNEASRQLLLRLGMKLEKREPIRGLDSYHFGLSRRRYLEDRG